MAAFPLVGHKLAGDLASARQLADSPFELRALHSLHFRTFLSECQPHDSTLHTAVLGRGFDRELCEVFAFSSSGYRRD